MRVRLTLSAIFFASASFAGGKDSTGTSGQDPAIHISLTPDFELSPAYRFKERKVVPEYRIRHKLHVANVMLYTGGALLLASVPVIVIAASQGNSANQSSPNYNRGNGMRELLLVTGGVLLGGAGLGLMIPGGLLRHKYQAQLQRNYP